MPEGWPRKNRRPTDRPTFTLRETMFAFVNFFVKKPFFYFMYPPPFDFVGVYEAGSLFRKLKNMSIFYRSGSIILSFGLNTPLYLHSG